MFINNKKNDKQFFDQLVKIKLNGKLSDYTKAVLIIKNKLSPYFKLANSDLSTLGTGIKLPKTSNNKQLFWDCNLINVYKNQINLFIKLKRQYSDFILNGEFESAQYILEEIKLQCGWSVWLIEASFFCAQQINGLEGNKKLLGEIYASRGMNDDFDNIYFISFMISERNEDGCDTSLLYRKWHSQIEKVEDESFKRYLKLITNYYIFNDLDKECSTVALLNTYNDISIYDTYEFVLRYLIEYEMHLDTKEIKLSLRIFEGIDDIRLERLYSKYNLALNFQTAIPTILVNTMMYPQIFNMVIKLGGELSLNKGYTDRYYGALTCLVNNSDDIQNALMFISQFSSNFKHIDEIYQLMEIPSLFLNVSEIELTKKLSLIYGNYISLEQCDDYVGSVLLPEVRTQDKNIIAILKNAQDLLDNGEIINISSSYDFSPYTKIHSLVLKFHSLMQQDLISKGFELFVSAYLDNINSKSVFKLDKYIKDKPWAFFKGLGSFVDSAIVIKAYLSENYDDRQIFNIKACWRSFMRYSQIKKPSDLNISHFNNDMNKYIFFLREICTPEILESDAVNFYDARLIKTERIKVCENLLNQGHDVKLVEEKDTLERNLAIADGLDEVETAGLVVDEERFKSVAKLKFKNDYDRYKSFLELDLTCKSKLTLEDTVSVESQLITNPLEEGDNILLKLIRDMGDMFLQNQEFGLDYYLSMRVRHGRLMGVARGPLERRKLITKYSDEEKKYLDNRYWLERYKNYLSVDKLKEMNSILCDFSEWFDTEVDNFRTRKVQVLSDEKPEGIFTINYTLTELKLIKNTISSDTTIEHFIDFLVDFFMHKIYISSVAVKKWIAIKLKKSINQRFLNLQSDINSVVSVCTVGNAIVSDITSARTEMNKVLDDIMTWFDISSDGQKAIRTYSFDNIVDISLSRITRIYQSFSPEIKMEVEDDFEFHSSVLASMVDAFSIVFSNAIIHGGKDDPLLTIKASMVDVNNIRKLNVVISNPADEDKINFVEIERIRNDIISNKLKTRQEGGSGFHKLAAMSMIDNHDDLNFGFSEGVFFVDITFTFDLI